MGSLLPAAWMKVEKSLEGLKGDGEEKLTMWDILNLLLLV